MLGPVTFLKSMGRNQQCQILNKTISMLFFDVAKPLNYILGVFPLV